MPGRQWSRRCLRNGPSQTSGSRAASVDFPVPSGPAMTMVNPGRMRHAIDDATERSCGERHGPALLPPGVFAMPVLVLGARDRRRALLLLVTVSASSSTDVRVRRPRPAHDRSDRGSRLRAKRM